MRAKPIAQRRQMLVLGGALDHRGGLEAFCERSAVAISQHAEDWRATWWPTDTAYLSPRHFGRMRKTWQRIARIDRREVDLVWLQWSTLADLLLLRRLVASSIPVIVTPHLGANARLQRISVLRTLCRHLLGRTDRLALLFAGQQDEIALPSKVPQTVIGTFLPESALTAPVVTSASASLRLIHAGRLGHGKGTFRMVALCAALRARNVAFSAQIVGRADAVIHAELVQAIAAADLGDALTLVDWMDEPAMVAALGQADVLVHLSALDSFPLTVLEALAVGTIPVAADMIGARTMVDHYGGFVATGDDGGVKAAADWIAAQDISDIRSQAAAIATHVRRDQAWETIVGRVIAIADQTLADTSKNVPL